MKPSKRNVERQRMRYENRLQGPPAVSKYAAKNGRGPVAQANYEDLERHFNAPLPGRDQ